MTTELIVFPDIEAALVSYLEAELTERSDTATVATHVPNPRPDRLVRITRVGGPRRDLVTDAAMVLFECWDLAEPDAAALCGLVRALVWAMAGQTIFDVWFRCCEEVGGQQFYPDPDTTLPRYQFTAQLDIRGEAV